MIRSTTIIEGQEVRAGARWRHSGGSEALRFDIDVICDSTGPDRFHGEVAFAGTTLIATETVDEYNMAARAAEAALKAKVVQLFSGSS